MSKLRYILTMDFGTQSVRVAIFNQNGDVLALEKEKYTPAYFSSIPTYAEQDPNYYFECLCKCTNRLAKNNKELLNDVTGITLTCFRDSAVLLDKDKNIIRPMILWLDQRNAECKKKLPFVSRAIFRLVGKSDAINFNRKRSVANWIKENEPENYEKIDKFLPISTYFIYLLTGEMKDSASNMAGHYPINFKKRKWYKNPEKHFQGQIFGIKGSWLNEIVPEGSLIGTINKEAAIKTGLTEGLKMYACGSDKSCETLGLGVIDDKTAAISYGTASTVEVTRKHYTESEPFLPGYPAAIPGYFNMDIQIYRGYWMINWFLKEFGGENIVDMISTDSLTSKFNENLDNVPPGSEGLILQPYWGPGLARPLAKGAIVGFSDAITSEHVYRAIIEGIAYALREGLEHFEHKTHHKIPAIRISGGGSQSDKICQITADIMNRPVSRVQTCETSSLGAAIAGFLAINEYKNVEDAVNNMVKVTTTFYPNKENAKEYDYLFNHCYKKMYPSLKHIYTSIKRYNRMCEKKKIKKS